MEAFSILSKSPVQLQAQTNGLSLCNSVHSQFTNMQTEDHDPKLQGLAPGTAWFLKEDYLVED